MNRRAFLSTCAVGGGLMLSGCLEQGWSPLAESPTSDPDTLVVPGKGDYPHGISVDNQLNHTVTLTVVVTYDGTTIYENKHEVPAQTKAVVAGITRTELPDRSESVTVSVTDSVERTASVTVDITECLGGIQFYYTPAGKLHSTYAIC